MAAHQIAIASDAIGGGLLVDRVGAPAFAVVAVTLGTLLTWRWAPRARQA